jgi:lipid-binding SYLF domain-containing protein
MTLNRRSLLISGAALAGAVPMRPVLASDADDARGVVDKARVTLNEMVKAKDFDALRAGLKSAKGVLIFPQILKAGFFIGGSGGTGVLLVRGAGNAWSEPAFYTMGAVSFGVQFGGQAAEVIILVNNQKGVDQLMTSSMKLGADASVAAGPVGVGQAADVTADFVSYAKAKGAFIGMSVEGSVVDVRESLNKAYYGKSVTPIDIIVKGAASNKQSAALRSALAQASK